MSLSRNSFASHRNNSKTIPTYVIAEIQLHLVEIILKQFQILSYSKFNAPHRNYSKTIPNFVLAEIHMPLIEIIL